MTVDQDTFRAVLGRFASGVTVVTAIGERGQEQGMTVSAFCSVSLDPPLILIAIDRSASMSGTLAGTSHFIVNILAAHQEWIARRFSGPDPDRFEGIGYSRGATGAALLDEVLGFAECERTASFDAGDHQIHLGRVIVAEAFDGSPLLYYRGGYAELER